MPIFRHRVSGPGPAGDIWISTMHSSSAGTLAAVHTAWTTLINNFCSGTMNGMWNTHNSATQTITDQLDPVTGKNVAQASSAITQVGTGVGGTTPPRVCVVIGLRTALPTRAGRGRMYWPAPDTSHFTLQGTLVSADATTIATGIAAALTAFKATATPVVYHRGPKTSDAVTSVTVGILAGTQRRRTNKDAQAYSSHTV